MYKLNDQSDVELHEDGASAFKAAEDKRLAEVEANKRQGQDANVAKPSEPAKKESREAKKAREDKAAHADDLAKSDL